MFRILCVFLCELLLQTVSVDTVSNNKRLLKYGALSRLLWSSLHTAGMPHTTTTLDK